MWRLARTKGEKKWPCSKIIEKNKRNKHGMVAKKKQTLTAVKYMFSFGFCMIISLDLRFDPCPAISM